MLLCDGCARGHHTRCLRPHLKVHQPRLFPLKGGASGPVGGVLTQQDVLETGVRVHVAVTLVVLPGCSRRGLVLSRLSTQTEVKAPPIPSAAAPCP